MPSMIDMSKRKVIGSIKYAGRSHIPVTSSIRYIDNHCHSGLRADTCGGFALSGAAPCHGDCACVFVILCHRPGGCVESPPVDAALPDGRRGACSCTQTVSGGRLPRRVSGGRAASVPEGQHPPRLGKGTNSHAPRRPCYAWNNATLPELQSVVFTCHMKEALSFSGEIQLCALSSCYLAFFIFHMHE